MEHIFYLEHELLLEMESTPTDEQEKKEEEKKCDAVHGNIGRLKELYDKTTTMKKKYDKMNDGYDSINNVNNKVRNGHRCFESDKVHPISSTATQQLSKQPAVNMVSQSATVPQVYEEILFYISQSLETFDF